MILCRSFFIRQVPNTVNIKIRKPVNKLEYLFQKYIYPKRQWVRSGYEGVNQNLVANPTWLNCVCILTTINFQALILVYVLLTIACHIISVLSINQIISYHICPVYKSNQIISYHICPVYQSNQIISYHICPVYKSDHIISFCPVYKSNHIISYLSCL